jgi:ABC-type nitrate/sulfonate/bicarbonate transport system substrate-binding protein
MERNKDGFGTTGTVTRRRFVALLGLGAGASLLAACAPAAAPSPTAAPAKPAEAPAAKPAESKPAEAAKPAESKPAETKPAAAAPAVKQTEAGPTNLPHAASTTWYGHVPFMVALEKGFFKEAGLNVELQPIVASSDRMLALTSGSIMWSNTGSASALAEMAKNNESFYWVGNVDDSPGNDGLVALPGINSFADLKGKKVGVTLNSDAEIILYQLLEANGLKPSDIEIVSMKANDMVAAFTNKNIDAYQVWEPAFTDGQKAVPGSKVLGTEKDTAIFKKNGTQVAPDVVVLRRELIDKYPDTTRLLLTAYFKGVDLVKSNPDEAAGIVAEKYFKKSKEDTLAGIKSFQFFGSKEQADRVKRLLGTFSDVIDWQHTNKRIETKPDPSKWMRGDAIPA